MSDLNRIVVGFAMLRLVLIHNHIVGNILWLGVHPKFRQNGIASALIDASIDYFENHRISNVYVSVRKNNLPALYLFEGKGFRKLDFRRLVELYGHRAMEVYLKMRITPGEIVLATTV